MRLSLKARTRLPRSPTISIRGGCLSVIAVTVFFLFPIRADEPDINLDGTPAVAARKSVVLELSGNYSIGNGMGWQPQLGGYLDLVQFWQAGIHARLATMDAKDVYDYLPEISLNLRKLWLGDEGPDPIRNSEYFCMSLGGVMAYEFSGERIGPRPLAAIAFGKYWMPFDNQPFGLDISLELARLLSGHIRDHTNLMFLTTGVALFYVLPRPF